MREGVVRVLENKLDPSNFKQEDFIPGDSDDEQV
jgi:hypothetical protein